MNSSNISRLLWRPSACLLVVLLTAAGCARTPISAPTTAAVRPVGQTVDLSRAELVRRKLHAQYQEWGGTRYRYGGLSKNGVDCSGFVYLTFREQLGLSVPRTTADQIRVGRAVARSALRPGDLVFFRTGYKVRHVGIYMGEQQFLHASTSRGVMISSLNNTYWRSKYWQARRPQV